MKPLRLASPPIIDSHDLDSFIECVFGNVPDLRETSRILEKLYVRQREQGPLIQYIGDIFLTAATEFRVVYPKYVGNLVRAGQRVKDELDGNAKFRAFHDVRFHSLLGFQPPECFIAMIAHSVPGMRPTTGSTSS